MLNRIMGALEARLGEMSGQRVRITVLDPVSRERYMRFPGVINGMTSSTLSVDCWQAIPGFAEGTPVTLAISLSGQMVRMHSIVQGCEPARLSRLLLDLPTDLETMEQRRHTRVEVKSPIRLVTEAEGHIVHGILRDLSTGGAALRTEEPLSPGMRVCASFSLSTGLIFGGLDAQVVRSSATGDGFYVLAVQFDHSPEKQSLLETYVQSRPEDG